MRWLIFLSRQAFIYNVLFAILVVFKSYFPLINGGAGSTIIILGYVLVWIVNPLVNISYLVLHLSRFRIFTIVPAWLISANILFLVFQTLYIIL